MSIYDILFHTFYFLVRNYSSILLYYIKHRLVFFIANDLFSLIIKKLKYTCLKFGKRICEKSTPDDGQFICMYFVK